MRTVPSKIFFENCWKIIEKPWNDSPKLCNLPVVDTLCQGCMFHFIASARLTRQVEAEQPNNYSKIFWERENSAVNCWKWKAREEKQGGGRVTKSKLSSLVDSDVQRCVIVVHDEFIILHYTTEAQIRCENSATSSSSGRGAKADGRKSLWKPTDS